MGNNKDNSILYKAFQDYNTKLFLIVNDFLALVTIISIFAIVLETLPSLEKYSSVFFIIEIVAVIIFTIEYIARIVVANKSYKNYFGFFRYIFSFFGLIDLLSIVPTYFMMGNLTFLKASRVLRVLRFLRMLRLAKLIRLKKKTKKDLEEHKHIYRLNLQIYFAALISAILIFGALIYIVDGDVYEFRSIPHGMLWSAKVILGGIPSITPPSILGEVFSAMARFCGLVLFGLLINVVGTSVKRLMFGSADLIEQKRK